MSKNNDRGSIEVEIDVQKGFINKIVLRIKEIESRGCACGHRDNWTVPDRDSAKRPRMKPEELAMSPSARVLKFDNESDEGEQKKDDPVDVRFEKD